MLEKFVEGINSNKTQINLRWINVMERNSVADNVCFDKEAFVEMWLAWNFMTQLVQSMQTNLIMYS